MSTRSAATYGPTARTRRCVPPIPGITPRVISGWPKRAVSAARMMSHIIASSHPPPSAYPDTAAITGVRTAANRPQAPKWSPMSISRPDFCSISLMSAPAANARSLPVTTIAPIASSASNASAAATTSRMTCEFRAFRASGRFSVIQPTRPRVSTRIVS